MTTTTSPHRVVDSRAENGGIAARRAVVLWAWRMFRREWRQQLLVVALLTVAVAATTFGAAVADNAPSSGRAAAFGTASGVLTLDGHDPNLTADIAAVRGRYGAPDVIENQTVPVAGTVNRIDLRVQDPHGRYGQPMLALVSGRYPTTADEVALTGGVAALFDLRLGQAWQQGGRTRTVVGLVQNPTNLLDQFALLAPDAAIAPTQVTVLFDLPPAPHPCASAACAGPPQFPGGATAKRWALADTGASPTTIVAVVAIIGLIFIGLVAVAGFTVMAQRRLRSLGMMAALGATDGNVRLVMVASGALVGIVGALLGGVIGLVVWVGYAPHLQAAVQHRVEWFHLPWLPLLAAMVTAILTAVAAASRPAGSATKVSVVAALSGRPESSRTSRRSAAAGLLLLGAGLGCLASAGGWSALLTQHNLIGASPLQSAGGLTGALSGWSAGQHGRLLAIGIAMTAVGVLLLAPLGVAGPAVVARRVPVAARLALRDLGRYRARSGAVVAAISFSVLLAVSVAILTTARSADPLEPTGPNLAANQVIVYTPHGSGTGPLGYGPPPTPAQAQALQSDVSSLASSTRAKFAVPLYSAGRLDSGGDTPEAGTNQRTQLWRASGVQEQYVGQLYVATPELLRDFGIDPGRIRPDTDLITSQPALSSVPHLELIGNGNISEGHTPTGQGIPGTFNMQCPPASCIVDPKIQVLDNLPTGTSAPTTLITEHALHAIGQQLIPDGWLVQTPGSLTPAEKSAARQVALTSQTRIEVGTGAPDLSAMRRSASAIAILLALAVLAMTVGLIRSETASDLRILAAAGAGRSTRRAITAATAGALGLTGAIIGTTAAYVGVAVWAHSDLRETLVPVPARELLAILIALPVLATVGGWLLAGREPRLLTRQPLE